MCRVRRDFMRRFLGCIKTLCCMHHGHSGNISPPRKRQLLPSLCILMQQPGWPARVLIRAGIRLYSPVKPRRDDSLVLARPNATPDLPLHSWLRASTLYYFARGCPGNILHCWTFSSGSPGKFEACPALARIPKTRHAKSPSILGLLACVE